MNNLTVFEQNGQLLTDSREVAMTQEERNEYLLKHENFIRCARCKNLIHSSNKYCQYCGCPNEKETFDMEFHDLELMILDAEKEAKKSERLANFSLGFSTFVLLFKIFVELVIKK